MAHTFTPEDAKKGAEASNAVQRANRAELVQRSEIVWRVVDEVGDLAPAALDAVLTLIERAALAVDDMDVSDALSLQRVAQSAEILHRISRLASGQSTSNAAHVHLSDEERRARMAQLRGDTPSPATE